MKPGFKRNSIYVKVEGGLGNQLFQLFAGVKLSQRYNKKLLLDMTNYVLYQSASHLKPYLLSFSRIEDTHKMIFSYPRLRREVISRITKLDRKIRHKIGFVLEDEIDTFEGDQSAIFVRGYFQDLKYLPEWETIWNYLKSIGPLSDVGKTVLAEILDVKPILIHVRRGDYLSQNQIYGLLSRDYYVKAIKQIEREIGNHPIWLMSDEPNEAKIWLDGLIDVEKIIDVDNHLTPAELLIVASYSNALVMANSTFSWWIAFIGSNRQTISKVAMPPNFTTNEVIKASKRLALVDWLVIHDYDED